MTNTAKILNFGRGNFTGQERNVADLDDGYARLSNMLLEAYSGADLTKRQFKVLLAILRKTYGWNKPMDRITDSQLSEITKLPVKRCNEAKLELVRMNIIKQQGGMFGPNKNISEWCIPQNEGKSPKTRDKTSLKLGDCYPSKQGDTKDTITKEKRKDYSSENSGESSDQPENDLSVVKPDAAIQSGSKWGTAEDLTAAEWMFDMVKTIAPSARKPNFAGWANDIRLMRERDGRNHRDMCVLFRWACQDNFWSGNVLSPAKLRDKWTQLEINRNKQQAGVTAGKPKLDLTNTDWIYGVEKRITDIRQVETTARYLGTGLYWIAASINIKPGHDYYFYVRSVNTVGKSAFVEAVGQPSDDASGYLDFFKGEIGKTHLAQELWTQIDNGQLAPDLTEIRTSITDVSNEITQTVNKKLEDQSAAIQQIQKVQVDTNNNLNSMWAVKLQQMQDGRLYIAGIGAGIENTPDGMQSQVLLAADRIAMINPANGNTKPMFVGQGDQIFMNEVFLKYLTAPTITSGGNPPAFSLTPDGRLTAKNADISGSVNANAGTLNNVTVNENCTIKGMLEATQVRGDFVKAVSKSFPKQAGTWGNTETPNGTVTVTISDDHNFDRQIIIPPIIFNGIAYSYPGSGNNPGGTSYTGYGFEVRKNGVLIASRETKGAIPGSYSAVIDMPSGRGSVTLEFKVFHKGNQWAGNITDCTVIVTKKAASGISIR
ncbi:DUF1983 domain-containing protein [Escherichia coli O51]|nr:DUF1983 domain-containing protein [Escherichia coli O51]